MQMKYVPTRTGQYLLVAAAGNRDRFTIKIDGATLIEQAPHDGAAYPAHVVIPLREGQSLDVEVRYFTQADAPHLGLGFQSVDALLCPADKKIVASADAAIVAVGMNSFYEREGSNRTFGLPWGQNELIRQTAVLNPRTIVDIQAGGAVDTHTWIDHVPALIDSWYGGQSTGAALAQVLFGKSPGGKLPISWERTAEDNPTYAHYNEVSGSSHKILYAEGIFSGYRFYTTEHKDPLFPFGYGLSYTSFELSNLKLLSAPGARQVVVEFDVRNTGSFAGAEVAQVYVSEPSAKIERPVKELKAFSRVLLMPGTRKHVMVTLDEKAFSYYDVTTHAWRMDPGQFVITVGNSSLDERLSGHVDFSH